MDKNLQDVDAFLASEIKKEQRRLKGLPEKMGFVEAIIDALPFLTIFSIIMFLLFTR